MGVRVRELWSLCSDARTVEVGDDISAKDAAVKDGEFPGRDGDHGFVFRGLLLCARR